eukprot:m.222761 g.222761  ORF g.222761 m.222761 type:complete len:334 (+) comp18739_c0_seq5:64-1065(+)
MIEASRSYMQAAELLAALAEGDWDPHDVDLHERLRYLAKAVTCAKIDTVRVAHAGEVLQHLEAKLEVAQLQREICDALLQRKGAAPAHGAVQLGKDRYGFTVLQYDEAVRQLNQKLMNISELHERFTEPFHLKLCTLDLVYCSGVNYDLEKLWSDVISDALFQHCPQTPAGHPDLSPASLKETFRSVLSSVLPVTRKYKCKSAYVPLEFICEMLELQSVKVAQGGPAHADVLRGLLQAGFGFAELYECYFRLHSKQLHAWAREGDPLHVLRVICTLLAEWHRSGVHRATVQWRQLRSIANDDIPRFKEELNGKGTAASELALRFRQIEQETQA